MESVNGKTGVVVLDAEDVGAATAAQVQSVADDVATNTQDIATLQAAYAALTQSDIVVGALPSSGVANTIYRVPSTSSYSDYMWDGSQFVLMATYTIPAGYGDLQKLISQRWGYVVFDTNSIIKKRIKLTSGAYAWASDYYCELIPTSSGQKYIIKANSVNYTQYCFLTSDSTTVGSTPDFADGYTGFIELAANKDAEVLAPDNAKYLYVYVGDVNMHRVPSVKLVDTETEMAISLLRNDQFLEIEKLGEYDYGISSNSSGKFGTDSSYKHDAIEVKKGDVYLLENIGDGSTFVRYCFATNTTSGRGATIPLVAGTTVHEVLPQKQELIICPTDCYLLYNSVGYDSVMKESLKTKVESIISPAILYGKNVAVLGDSIDTHGNSGTDKNAVEITIETEDIGIELSAYLTYYDVEAGLSLGGHTFTSSEIGTEVTFTPTAEDVGKVIGLPNNYNSNSLKVWWQYLSEAYQCNIIPVAWSGSGYTRNRADSSAFACSYAWHPSQIRKCGIRTPGTMSRVSPDVIILNRGINDMTHTPYAELTEGFFGTIDWAYPEDDSVDGGFGFLEGLSVTVKELREAYPNAVIVLATMTPTKRVNASHFPMNNGLATEPSYNNAIREAADFFGCQIIEFDKAGITYENMYPTYMDDSATAPTHPNANGHKVLGKYAVTTCRNMFFEL